MRKVFFTLFGIMLTLGLISLWPGLSPQCETQIHDYYAKFMGYLKSTDFYAKINNPQFQYEAICLLELVLVELGIAFKMLWVIGYYLVINLVIIVKYVWAMAK